MQGVGVKKKHGAKIFFCLQPNANYVQNLEVRVGTSAAPAGLGSNPVCGDVKMNAFQKSKLVFDCPKPGLFGNVVSIRNSAGNLYTIEVEVLGLFSN